MRSSPADQARQSTHVRQTALHRALPVRAGSGNEPVSPCRQPEPGAPLGGGWTRLPAALTRGAALRDPLATSFGELLSTEARPPQERLPSLPSRAAKAQLSSPAAQLSALSAAALSGAARSDSGRASAADVWLPSGSRVVPSGSRVSAPLAMFGESAGDPAGRAGHPGG